VPAENVLGEIGRGHKIAFNVLNVGRWKLGAGAVGGMKTMIKCGLDYARQRAQFGRPILAFGAIRKKLARATAQLFAVESMCYRVAGLIDERTAGIEPGDPGHDKKAIDAIEEYAIEASILKVAGSEALAETVDEMVQLHGGYGFLEEYLPARVYRDNRINRIFEGTNEVNRLLIPGTLIKRALSGGLPLMQAFAEARAAAEQTRQAPIQEEADVELVASLKRATVYTLGVVVGRYLSELSEQQAVLEALADAVIQCFAVDSALGRALMSDGEQAAWQRTLFRAYASEAAPVVCQRLRTVLTHSAADPAERAAHLTALRRLVGDPPPADEIALREEIATRLERDGAYTP
jgi:alkylation response protein AidB-like acyl-CoA dehydrogenase